ncbi:MAG: oxidoreductase [Deltaproteobacteria bacterium RBG_13_49_15]|nr:MAG: oxidoreductase [Deltaproteobacteria bacterium RBG_13_49_15]
MMAAIAVVGSGYWGKNLIRNFHDLGALTLICDKNETLLSGFKQQYLNVDVCLAFNDVMGRSDIDGIVIATPAETHFPLIREALFAGKHVFAEKPLVLHEHEAVELIELAKAKSLVLMVGHLLQYHPAFIRLKELIRSGELGRINYIYSNRLNLGKIRREENILWSFAPHDVSMILSLAGEEPESVIATGGNYLHRKIADVTTTHLIFPSGLRAHIFVSWLHPFKEQKLVVVGDRKMAVFDDTQPWEDKLHLFAHEIKWQNNIPVPTKADPERVEIPREEPLRSECRHFLDCIEKDILPITDGEEGLRVLRVLNAAQSSLVNNGESIDLIKADQVSKDEKGLLKVHPSIEKEPSDFFIHPSSVIDEGCEIGSGTKIWHFSHILSGSKIGTNCNIGQNAMIGPDVVIGSGCKIQNNVSIYKGVTLEDDVFCGPSMVFTNVYNPRAHISRMSQIRKTLVRRGATIGANATIICGVTVGQYAFIGAGATVNKEVPDHALVAGVPARQIGWVCSCGERLNDALICNACNNKYSQEACGLEILISCKR